MSNKIHLSAGVSKRPGGWVATVIDMDTDASVESRVFATQREAANYAPELEALYRDELVAAAAPAIADMGTPELRDELAELNERRADDERRTAICQELTLRMIALELPEDWNIWQEESHEGGSWFVSRDHGSLVVGAGYHTLAQAFDVARRTLADEAR